MLSPYGDYVSIVCPGYTDTPILDTNTGKDMTWKLKPEDVATTIIDGLKRDYAVIECNMAYVRMKNCDVDTTWVCHLLFSICLN